MRSLVEDLDAQRLEAMRRLRIKHALTVLWGLSA
jgi:hypothetical protein